MSSTPSKAKDKERIIKLLHESILHLCKVSVSGPGNIEVDGIVCITQPNESDIVVKVHEIFSNVHNEGDGKSPSQGEKRKHSQDGDGNKTPRKSGTPVSRRLIAGDTIDLSEEDDKGVSRLHRSPNRNKKSDIIDLTSGRATPAAQQMNITQVRSLQQQQQQQRFGGTQRYQRFVSVRGRSGYQMVVPRQRFGNMVPPGMRQMGPQVRPVGGPIPHRGFRPHGGQMMGVHGVSPVKGGNLPSTQGPGPNPGVVANNGNKPFDEQPVHGYKGLRCKFKDCNFACSNKYYLETHVLQHFESDPFTCNEEGCEFKSKNKQNLYQHYKATHGANNPQFCFKCTKAFKSPEELAAHTKTCSTAAIKCDHCGEMIMGMMAMAKHLSDVYIAESTRAVVPESSSDQAQSHTSGSGASQSPATTPSPGHNQSPVSQSPQRPHAESPVTSSENNVPDMSAPLNIIPDAGTNAPRPQNPTDTPTVQPEIQQLQQMAGSSSPQPTRERNRYEQDQYQQPPMSTTMYDSQQQQQQQQTMLQATSDIEQPPDLQQTMLSEQYSNLSNLDLLNEPMPMDQHDPIQMPSLGDPMSLPGTEQMDIKPPDFDT